MPFDRVIRDAAKRRMRPGDAVMRKGGEVGILRGAVKAGVDSGDKGRVRVEMVNGVADYYAETFGLTVRWEAT